MLETKHQALIDVIGLQRSDALANLKLCMKLLSTTTAIDRSCKEKLNQYQLSESRLLVLTLLQEKGALTPQVIAELSGVSKASMTQQLNTLFKDHLIEKQEVIEDRRKYSVVLTKEGKDLIAKALEEHTQWIQTITNTLTPEEMEQLDHILGKIITNVRSA